MSEGEERDIQIQMSKGLMELKLAQTEMIFLQLLFFLLKLYTSTLYSFLTCCS